MLNNEYEGLGAENDEVFAESRATANVDPRASGPEEEEEADRQRMLQFIWKNRTDLQKRVAEQFVKRGDVEGAKRVLSTVRQVDPKATALLDLAKIYEKKGEVVQAADAYLGAYRLQPDLLSDDHMERIIKAERTGNFVEVFSVENLRKLGYVEPSAKIVRRLILEKATREDGIKFLKRVWVARPDTHLDLLSNRTSDELWDLIPDSVPLVRAVVLPTNFPAEGAGWDRFTFDLIGDREGGGSSKLLKIKPFIQDK